MQTDFVITTFSFTTLGATTSSFSSSEEISSVISLLFLLFLLPRNSQVLGTFTPSGLASVSAYWKLGVNWKGSSMTSNGISVNISINPSSFPPSQGFGVQDSDSILSSFFAKYFSPFSGVEVLFFVASSFSSSFWGDFWNLLIIKIEGLAEKFYSVTKSS